MPFLLRTTVSLPWTLALGAIWGGAAGNLIDRIFRAPGPGRGHVVDFIAYFDWFIGNVADVILFLAIIAILVLALRDIPRIRLPQAWTVCGGPAYVAAARSLVRQVAAH